MTMLKTIRKSAKLANVCYDIRGPVLARAKLMEEEGHRIIKLNIGNLAPFGFDTPDEVRHDVIVNLPQASGYSRLEGAVRGAQGDHALHAAEGHRRRRRSTTSSSATACPS